MITISLVCVSLCLLIPLSLCLYKLWWIPLHLQHVLRSQGIKGPPYKFIRGNTNEIIKMMKKTTTGTMDLSHDIFPLVQPHLHAWIKLYGNNIVMWRGTQPQIVVTEPELIKEILSNKEGTYKKNIVRNYIDILVGNGIIVAEGEKWQRLRKLANHAFHSDPLKDMFPEMVASVESMLERWRLYDGKEIEVCADFKLLTAEVISRTAFGSSYVEGSRIFESISKLCTLISTNTEKIRLLGMGKLINTDGDIEAKKIEKSLHRSILEIVKKREDEILTGGTDNYGSDFLGSLLRFHHDIDPKNRITTIEIIDECKIFYFAGQETTHGLLCWSVLLLATHTVWQEKARKEVLELFGQEKPNVEGIVRMKVVTMIINETPCGDYIQPCGDYN